MKGWRPQTLPDRIEVPLEPDFFGFIGRECPSSRCGRYFKVKKRIGFMFGSRTYTCPYCGNEADPDEFHTQDQIEYARSVAVRQFEEEVYRSLKKMEFDVRPPSRAALGIGMSLKVSRSSDAHPIHHYREKRLETEIACDRCGLRYTIYGVFGY